MSNLCQTGTELENKEIEEIDCEENIHKIFKKWVDDRAKKENVKHTKILKKILEQFCIERDISTIKRWYKGSRTPQPNDLFILSQITGISLYEFYTGKKLKDSDKDYFKKIDIDEETANQLCNINNEIHWSFDNLVTMEKLEIAPDTSEGLVKINKSLKRSPVPLFKRKYETPVSLSKIVSNCVEHKDDTIKTLKLMSDILNRLNNWKYEDKDPELLNILKDYSIGKSKKYDKFYTTIPKEIKDKIDRVEEDVSNMIKYYILDDFINNKK